MSSAQKRATRLIEHSSVKNLAASKNVSKQHGLRSWLGKKDVDGDLEVRASVCVFVLRILVWLVAGHGCVSVYVLVSAMRFLRSS